MRGRDETTAAAPLGEVVKGLRQVLMQGQSLPRAATSLDESARRLAGLGDTLETTLQGVAGDLVSALRDGILEIRADMKSAVEDTGTVTRQAFEPVLERSVERAVSIAAERTEALAGTLRDHMAARSEADDVLIARLDERVAALAERIATQQETFAERMAESVRARTEALLDRLEASASALRDAGREQQAALTVAVESAEARVASLEAETGRRLHALFDALQAGATRQAESLVGFEQRLAEARASDAEFLRQALSQHGSDLSGQLGAAGEQLREAASLVQAGGAELSALAEAFAQAVERHRDASATWLERLGDVEGAVDRAGREAAAEALGAQLAATEEVLARQLDFQRELYEQLRDLRGGPRPERADGDGPAAAEVAAENAPDAAPETSIDEASDAADADTAQDTDV